MRVEPEDGAWVRGQGTEEPDRTDVAIAAEDDREVAGAPGLAGGGGHATHELEGSPNLGRGSIRAIFDDLGGRDVMSLLLQVLKETLAEEVLGAVASPPVAASSVIRGSDESDLQRVRRMEGA
jgi:hypothetical protein